MTNNQKRWLLFLIAIPLLIAIIFIDYANHLAINLAVLAIALMGTHEMCLMLNKAGYPVAVGSLTAASTILPIATYLVVMGVLPEQSLALIAFTVSAVILVIPIFTMSSDGFSKVIPTVAGSILALVYPGFFLTYIVRFSGFQYSTHVIIMFMLTVYLNDSFAWFVGNLFGRNSRKVFVVSPNKSMVGFIGGIAASLFVTISGGILYPQVFTGPLYIMIILGFVAGCTTILGDLIESGIKRSSGVKDSGTIVMGRGGLLDSIDSLLLTAPVFYYLLKMTAL
ncbi:MAG: hypothetical protein B6241_02945 [Spirochaetaceae bacterium 4572_59]|nr:MAG: hypothetical protein B6241_02945 [Spirochaetaceae bacterium 4572_59]